MPGVPDRPGTQNNLFPSIMSRAVVAEAVLSNVLHYINETKHIRQGSAIACRNFLLSICFHKHSIPLELQSARKIAQLTNIHRRTLAASVNSKQCLRNIRYKPFAKGTASNYWGKRAVSLCVFFFNFRMSFFYTAPQHCMKWTLQCKNNACVTGRFNSLERS